MQGFSVGPVVIPGRSHSRRTACGLLSVLALTAAAAAATITVNTTTDTLAGMTTTSVAAFNASVSRSLRGAIIAVNNDPTTGHTISLPAGTYTLALANATPTTEENAAATGDIDILKPVTITGAGSATTIVQAGTSTANGIDKILSVNPQGARAGVAVALSGLTLRYGRNQIVALGAGSNAGGAMDFDAGTPGTGSLTLSDVVFDQNATTNGDGGALALFNGGTVTVANCSFTANAAGSTSAFGGSGGAVFIGYTPNTGGSVALTNCLFDGNRTVASTGAVTAGNGGGLFSFTDGVTTTTALALHNCIIRNNAVGVGLAGAALDGGGLYAGAFTLDQGSSVTSNTASHRGGGIFVTAGATTVSGATIVGNNAGAGKGGAAHASGGTTTFSSSRIVANTASGGGSALSTSGESGALIAAANNWFGFNAPAAALFGTGVTATPNLVLTVTATPTTVVYGQDTASIVASLTKNSVGTTGFSVPAGIPVTFSALLGTINPLTSALVAGTQTATFTPTGAGAGSAAATVDNQTVTAPIAVITTFASWQQQQFGANAGNPAVAGPAADPDGDGLSNLLEYALGLNPNLPSQTSVVVDTTTGALRLTATRNPGATDLTYLVEVSTDLVAWTNADTTVVTSTPALLQVLDNTPISGATRRFIRLKITKP